MQVVSLRSLARQAPSLEQAVLVTHRGQVIGRYLPAGDEDPAAGPIASSRQQTAVRADAPTERAGHGFGSPRPAPKPGR